MTGTTARSSSIVAGNGKAIQPRVITEILGVRADMLANIALAASMVPKPNRSLIPDWFVDAAGLSAGKGLAEAVGISASRSLASVTGRSSISIINTGDTISFSEIVTSAMPSFDRMKAAGIIAIGSSLADVAGIGRIGAGILETSTLGRGLISDLAGSMAFGEVVRRAGGASSAVAGASRIADHFKPVVDIQNAIVERVASAASLATQWTTGFDFDEAIERHYPPNWPKDLDERALAGIAEKDGIPIVWVCPPQVLEALVTTDNRDERFALLLDYREEILNLCEETLERVVDSRIGGDRLLATRVLATAKAGFLDGAQALAVNTLDTILVRSGVPLKNPPSVKKHCALTGTIVLVEMIYRYTRAPIVEFASAWRPGDQVPEFDPLSRNRSVHGATPTQYSGPNAIVATMLLVSYLRTLQHEIDSGARV